MTMRQIVDKSLNKFISRKLLVWLTATSFLYTGYITNEQWVALALAYVGVQGFADIAVKWKRAGSQEQI
jgi:hypothetical protein|tara:strand:- start:17 stop:223 length:207 start_codon:yes stop_codon:yes gene_type:complete